MKKRGSRLLRSLLAALLMVAITIVATIFFFNARPESKLVAQLPVAVPAVGDAAFPRLLEAYLGKSLVQGNQVELFRNGEAIFTAKIDAIESAESSVHFEVYEFWGEYAAARITDALVESAKRGITVRVLLDFFGSARAENGYFERMREAGVELVRWRSPSWYESGRFNNRTHRKLLVVDGSIGFTGGANVGDDWWTDNEEQPTYRDNHYRFEGPIVSQLQSAFIDNWLRASNELLVDDAVFPELNSVGDQSMQTIISTPADGKKRVRTFLLLAIAAAQERIWIQTAFFYVDPIVREALIAARKRGVEVVLLGPGETGGYNWVRLASRNRWGKLLEAGVRIYEYDEGPFHSKLFIFDDQLTSVGSVNLHNRSMRLNDETDVNVFCEGFTAKMANVFMEDLEQAIGYDLERWQERPWSERIRGIIGNAVGPHL